MSGQVGIVGGGQGTVVGGMGLPDWVLTKRVMVVVAGVLGVAIVLGYVVWRWQVEEVKDGGFVAGKDIDPWSLSQVLGGTPPCNGYKNKAGVKILECEKTPGGMLVESLGSREEIFGEGEEVTLEFAMEAAAYGSGVFRISYGEVQSMLASQRVCLSPQMPKPFYLHMRELIRAREGIGQERECGSLVNVKEMGANFGDYGFGGGHGKYGWNEYTFSKGKEALLHCLACSTEQIGAMVVKTQDFRVLMNAQGEIIEREVGADDALQLVTACGSPGVFLGDEYRQTDVLSQTFTMILEAAGDGILVMPSIEFKDGTKDQMVVYWGAFFEIVASSAGDRIKHIYVNPTHRSVEGFTGGEFDDIYAMSKERFKSPNLEKIVNVKENGDVYLAYGLKQAFPHQVISLEAWAGPHETLGGRALGGIHAAIGTAGLSDEEMTHVQEEDRIKVFV